MSGSWSYADVPPQLGRRALVTGANSGIGLVTARELARAGATVLLAGRDPLKLDTAVASIRAAVPTAAVSPLVLDLGSLESIKNAAALLIADGKPLDLLINNAAVMGVPERRTTVDGFELTVGTNHLGHFALTGRVLPLLLRAPLARVVTVSAGAAAWQRADLDDLQSVSGYRPLSAYATSKLANVAFSQELARRAAGTPLTAVAVHPGTAGTSLQRYRAPVVRWLTGHLLTRLLGQDAQRAARPSVYAATTLLIPNGAYLGPHGRRQAPVPVELPADAADPVTTARLWTESELLTGVRYDFSTPTAPPSTTQERRRSTRDALSRDTYDWPA